MKKLLLMAALAMAGAACGGASNHDVQTAKAAQYTSTADQLFDIALQTTQAEYKIGPVEPADHRFSTEPQFYNSEGGRQSPGAGGFVAMSDGSIQLTMIVDVIPTEGGHFAVVVTPLAYQVIAGSPKPRELKPNDPYLPGWVHGRVDTLAVAIYEHAKSLVTPGSSAADAKADAKADRATDAASPPSEPPATAPAGDLAPATPATPAPAPAQ